MSRGLRAVAVALVAIWMVPGIASFAIGVHLLVEHHDHDGKSHDGESALEERHHHSPPASADQLHEIVLERRVLEQSAFVAVATIGGSSFPASDLVVTSAAWVPPRIIPPSGSLLHTLCTLLI
ncbi:MAG TPA: hypothetical protein VMT00_16400 [Thermoanaerobaculia bacterium]|nr:hypothetical protein [Thermoanaerobaculia bacterium]